MMQVMRRWNEYRLYVIWKRLMKLQHEVRVTSASFGTGQNWTNDVTFLLVENLWANN